MIKIDAFELKKILDHTPAEQNIMIIGRHGIGKSKILKDYYENERKIPVIAFFLGQMSDPGDLIGLMHLNTQTGLSEFMPPYWWPTNNKPVVLFLDELNRARPEILQSVMDLTLNRTLAGKTLPQGSIVISAINYGEEYQVTDLDPALVSRFNIYEFEPTVDDWLIWANKAKLDKRVIEFIQKHHEFLDNINEFQKDYVDVGIEKTPDRRAWEKVSNLIANVQDLDDIYRKILAGIVGVRASLIFMKSLHERSLISAEDVLFRFDINAVKALKLQDFILLNEQIIQFIHNDNYDKSKKTLMHTNLLKYIKNLKKRKLNEGIAHFTSLLENSKYEKALTFVFAESEDLMAEISEYIKGIGR